MRGPSGNGAVRGNARVILRELQATALVTAVGFTFLYGSYADACHRATKGSAARAGQENGKGYIALFDNLRLSMVDS